MKKILAFAFLVLSINSFSQNGIEYIDKDSLREEILTEQKAGNYEKILELITKINKNDSLYVPYLLSKSYYQIQLKHYHKAIETTEEGLTYKNIPFDYSFRINQAIAWRKLEKYEKAHEVLDSGIIKYPMNFSLNYHKGLVFEDEEKYSEAIQMFKLSAIINPFSLDVHLKLGNICLKQHLTAQALMCFNTYLLLAPDGRSAFSVLKSVNELVSINNQREPIKGLVVSKDDSSFSEINLILDNRVGLNDDYPIDNEINVAFVKQNHVLLELLKTYKGNDGFWDRKYVKLYQWIANNSRFDDFVYTAAFSIENPKYKKIVDKKLDRVKEFYQTFKTKWGEINENNQILIDGKKKTVSFTYTNNRLEGTGTKENDTYVGDWKFYNSRGSLLSEGSYTKNGKRTGFWIWYNTDGSKDESAEYKTGKMDGKNIGYHKNGHLAFKANYKNDLLNGEYTKYYEAGGLNQKSYYNNGKLDGKYTSYYEVGETLPEYNLVYKNDEPDGKVVQYSPEGVVIYEVTFENGNREGLKKNYYPNGKIFSEADFVNGKLHGWYREFDKNGNLVLEGKAENDMYNGPWKKYYPNGTLKEEEFYKNGQSDGVHTTYAPDGKKHFEHVLRKGEFISYKFYDKEGKVISEGDKKGGEFHYLSYTPDANKNSEGLYNIDGGMEGEWKFYTTNGVLAAKCNYKEHNLTGKYYNYYNNGQIEIITNYENDTISGYQVSYFLNGKIREHGWYKKGLRTDVWRTYYKNGNLRTENYYHKGEFHGEQIDNTVEGKKESATFYAFGNPLSQKNFDKDGKVYEEIDFTPKNDTYTIVSCFPSGKKNTEVTYKNGVEHGRYTYWGADGTKLVEGNYVNGNMSGEWLWYYESGALERKATLVMGTFDGTAYDYYENGKLETKTEYNLDERNGVAIDYAEDGITVIGRTEFVNGQQHGRKEFFDEKGRLQLVRFYEYGRLIGYAHLNKSGQEIPMISVKNESAKITCYYDNGNKAREMEFVNGWCENAYREYYYDGQLKLEHQYKNDDYNGVTKRWYANGQLKEEIPYQDGEKNGTAKKYFKNGKIKEAVSYMNGSRSGEAKYYNSDGKLIKTVIFYNDYKYN